MDPLRYLAESDGFFTRAQARDLGYTDLAVRQLVRRGLWKRIRRGYYTFADIWNALSPEGRHLARAHAVAHSLGDAVALSGVSGLIAHGVATWGMPLDRVHVTRLDRGAGRAEGDVVHHEGLCVEEEVLEVNGRRVLSPQRCAIEAGSRSTPEAALVSFDSLLHLRMCNHEQLISQFRLMSSWPFTRRLHVPVRMADGAAESAGETRGRWLFWLTGLPAPILQYAIHDANGRLVGRCDWGWPQHGLVGEFDGRLKYGRLLAPTQHAGEVVFAEKRREDLIREITGAAMVRLVWDDFERPRVTRARIEALMRRAG
jgi:hypothetical protein